MVAGGLSTRSALEIVSLRVQVSFEDWVGPSDDAKASFCGQKTSGISSGHQRTRFRATQVVVE